MTTSLDAPSAAPIDPTERRRPAGPSRLWPAAVGVVSAMAVLAVAELLAVFVGAGSSPLFAVGAWVIDLVPAGVKDLVISLFGTADKIVLLGTLGVLVLALAAVAGVLERRRPPFGIVVLVAVSGIAALAVTTRPDASGGLALPTVVGMLVGAVVLRLTTIRLARWQEAAATPLAAEPSVRQTRRAFVGMLGFYGVASVVVGVGARMVTAGATAVSAARSALRLPAAATTVDAVPVGATLDDIEGISSFITPNASFYRIDTALQVPNIEPSSWSLKITGMVENEVEISFDELLALPLEEHRVTLSCVSNTVGGDLIGNALWLGYPIRDLLARAKPTADADMVLSRSIDGFTASTPLETLVDPDRAAILAVGMNGEPLPVEHGFPVRMVVPGLYGYVSATKWVVELKVTTFAADMGYWTSRGWTAKGPIKTESRIDVPQSGSGFTAGTTVAIAGVAWAPHTGIQKVEVRIDDGQWTTATLPDLVTTDSWLQWTLPWVATAGDHRITVRATDASGYTQTEDEAPPAPDGATGWDSITVTVQ